MRMLPFYRQFHVKILEGIKTKTSRSKAYGKKGDIVDSPVGPLRLTNVERVTLQEVRDDHWEAEGVDSPEEFEEVWVMIHPKAGFQPDKIVVLHTFQVVKEGEQLG